MVSLKVALNNEKKKAKYAWKCYFKMKEKLNKVIDMRSKMKVVVDDVNVDLTYLKNEYINMYVKLGKLCECSVCMNDLEVGNIYLSNCGHMVCMGCRETMLSRNMLKCPECRADVM